MQPSETGPCRNYLNRWYYDHKSGTCISFIYGGCKGNRNNFFTLEECEATCQTFNQIGTDTQIIPNYRRQNLDNRRQNFDPNRIDCMMTPWSDWSRCSVTCGVGFVERVRMVKVEPKNGGKPCPTKLTKQKRCVRQPCLTF